ERGWRVIAPHYRGDASERRDLLLETIAGEAGPVALTGSSMGGIVSVMAAQERPVAGLFLLAPAVYYPGHDHLDHSVETPVVHIIHGWRDDVIAPDWVIRFAREHRATLSLVDDDHRLSGDRLALERIYADFLDALDRAETAGGPA
ncbi:MAG: alpha/beta hydrolase, partial [Pseudomonadota bacterium]